MLSLALDLSPPNYYYYYFISIPSILSRSLSFLPSLPLFLLSSILSFFFPSFSLPELSHCLFYFFIFVPIPHLDFPSFLSFPLTFNLVNQPGFSGTPVLGSPDRGSRLLSSFLVCHKKGKKKFHTKPTPNLPALYLPFLPRPVSWLFLPRLSRVQRRVDSPMTRHHCR